MTARSSLHLVVRYSDRLLGVDTVARHKEVLRKQKHVWVGKIGRGLLTSRFETQLVAKIPTFVYLAKQTPNGLQFTRARLIKIQSSEPTELREAIPAYYHEYRIVRRIGMWMLVKSLQTVGEEEIRELITQESARRVTTTLKESSAGAFIVGRVPVNEQALIPKHQRKVRRKLIPHAEDSFRGDWDEADDDFELRDLPDDL